MEYHLVILVHGLWGNTSHFSYVKNQLEASYNEHHPDQSREQLIVYKTGSNEGYKTYDGIDICGKRVAQEIELEIERLENGGESEVDSDNENKKIRTSGGRVVKISVIGYSLGGLIARYAVGILYHKHYFDNIEPVNFTTFCTPHVGVLTPGNGVSIKFFNWLVPFLLANSGKQMFLKDKATVSNISTPAISRNSSSNTLKNFADLNRQPLLLLMANPASIFHKSLKSFKYRSLYANVVNDKRTSWWTAGISLVNPFEPLDVNPNIKIDLKGCINLHNGNKLNLSYVDEYSPVVIDASKPVKIITKGLSLEAPSSSAANPLLQNIPTAGNAGTTIADREKAIAADYAENFFKRKFKWVIVIFNIVVYAPLWVSWFIVTNLIERFKSGIRVLKESDAGSLLELYQLADENTTGNTANIKAMDNEKLKQHSRRPSLTRSLSETYEDLENKLEQNLQDQTDELMESVWDAMMSKKIQNEQDLFWFNEREKQRAGSSSESVTQGGESVEKDSDALITSFEELATYEAVKNSPLSSFLSVTDTPSTSESTPLIKDDLKNFLSNFKLDFNNKAQFEIIKNLNLLEWKKFPIYIQNTTTTHAAAIVRHPNKNFQEGEVVVRHYCDEVFQLK